jgi:hypothetical protein
VEFLSIPFIALREYPPVALGSGKFGSPWERRQTVYASCAFNSEVVIGPPLFPAAAFATKVVDEPRLATPGEAEPPPQAEARKPRPTSDPATRSDRCRAAHLC